MTLQSTSPRVLIVDDDEDVLGLLAQGLKGRPLSVTFCESGRAALAAFFAAHAAALPFDALVLDCSLPYVDGFAVASVVRCAERQSGVFTRARIAFYTAYDKTVEKTTLLEEVAADAYWPKVIYADRISEMIEEFAYGRETPGVA